MAFQINGYTRLKASRIQLHLRGYSGMTLNILPYAYNGGYLLLQLSATPFVCNIRYRNGCYP